MKKKSNFESNIVQRIKILRITFTLKHIRENLQISAFTSFSTLSFHIKNIHMKILLVSFRLNIFIFDHTGWRKAVSFQLSLFGLLLSQSTSTVQRYFMLTIFSFDLCYIITAFIIILAEIFNDNACLRRDFSKQILFIYLLIFFSPFACNRIETPMGKLRTESTRPIAKYPSLRLSDRTFFARWILSIVKISYS